MASGAIDQRSEDESVRVDVGSFVPYLFDHCRRGFPDHFGIVEV